MPDVIKYCIIKGFVPKVCNIECVIWITNVLASKYNVKSKK